MEEREYTHNLLNEHNDYEYAHPQAMHPLWVELKSIHVFMERVIGGLMVIAALVGGGAIGYFGHLVHLW